MQQAVALLEEAVLGMHEGQHLRGGTGETGPRLCAHAHTRLCSGTSPACPHQALTESKISNFFLACRTLICQGRSEQAKGVRAEVAYGLYLATESTPAAVVP